jgi:AcrR family transcriptional regulator
MGEGIGKSYHHGNLRTELLEAAEAQLAEAGAEALSLRALARKVGVSQTAPYRHFQDKSDLLGALATRGYTKLLQQLELARLRAGDDPVPQLYAFAHSYVTYAVNNRDVFKLMFGPLLQPNEQFPELQETSRATYDLVRDIMRRGIEQNVFLHQDVEYLANAGWSGIHGLATLKLDSPELFERKIDLQRQIDLGVRIFVTGLANLAPDNEPTSEFS